MKFEFTGTFPERPEMPLRARLAWEYFFGGKNPDWACVKTSSGCWIVTDEAHDLGSCDIYLTTEDFVSWLDRVAFDHLSEDADGFLENFVSVPGLLSEDVVKSIKNRFVG